MTHKILSLDLSIKSTRWTFALKSPHTTAYEWGCESFSLGTPAQVKKMNLTLEQTQGEQLIKFSKWLREMLLKYKPTEICCEKAFLSLNNGTEVLLQQRGVMIMTAVFRDIPVTSYATSQLKSFALKPGYLKRYSHLSKYQRGKATKKEMIEAMYEAEDRIFKVTDDEADSYHCCRLHLSKIKPSA